MQKKTYVFGIVGCTLIHIITSITTIIIILVVYLFLCLAVSWCWTSFVDAYQGCHSHRANTITECFH